MKLFLATVTLLMASLANAQLVDLADGQKRVDQFLSEHEVISTAVYCRKDIPTPECRMLMRYKNKVTSQNVNSFQMAFTAPFRQAAGTEFFFEVENSGGKYLRFMDVTADGKVNIDGGGNTETVIMDQTSLVIKGIKFGPTTGDLSFDQNAAKLIGEKVSPQDPNVKTPVNLIYSVMKFEAAENLFPEGKKFGFSFYNNNLRLDIVQDLTQKNILTTTATCNFSVPITVSVSAPVEIKNGLIINKTGKTSNKAYNADGEWCTAIIPQREMSFNVLSDTAMQVTNDPLHPAGMQWNLIK